MSPLINVWTGLTAFCILITIILALVFAFDKSYKDKKILSTSVWGFTAIIGGLVSIMPLVAGLIHRKKLISNHDYKRINIHPSNNGRIIIRPNAKKNLKKQDAMIVTADHYNDVIGELYDE